MSFRLALFVAIGLIVLAGCGSQDNVASLPPGASATTASAAGASAPATPSASGELLTDEIRQELGLVLLPIPDGAPTAKVGQEEAVAKAGNSFGRKDAPAVVEHGLGSVSESKRATVWLIVYPVIGASPEPAGPACPGSNQAAAQVVITLQGAMVSDQTGRILTSFDHGYRIPPESPCPTVKG